MENEIDELASDIEDFPDDELAEEETETFKIHKALPPPRAYTITTEALHRLVHQGTIELSPDYQRDVVWNETKQVGLIDSIFRNYYIPPILFSVQSEGVEGEDMKICVDGKQRLTSIQKFIDGLIPYRDPVTKNKYWFVRAESQKSKLELPDTYKKSFLRKQVTCVEYNKLQPNAERDIFQRVQLGMPLTAAERLQAISAPWADWVRELQKKFIDKDEGFGEVLDWNTKRGRDFQCLAQLVYAVHHLPELVTFGLSAVEKFLLREDRPSHVFRLLVNDVLSSFLKIANTKELNKAFTLIKKKVAPVEFVACGILLAKMKNASWNDKAVELYNMRKAIRADHKDIRANERVMKDILAFIRSVKVIRGDSDWDADPSSPSKSKNKAPKRKRELSEELDAEYRPAPVFGVGTSRTTRRA